MSDKALHALHNSSLRKWYYISSYYYIYIEKWNDIFLPSIAKPGKYWLPKLWSKFILSIFTSVYMYILKFFINRKEVSTCCIPVSALQLFLLKY